MYPAKLVQSSASSEVVIILNRVERYKQGSTLFVERIDGRLKELKELSAKLKELADKKDTKKKDEDALAKKKNEMEEACQKPKSKECKKLKKEYKDLEKKLTNEIDELAKAIQDLEEEILPIANSNVDKPTKIKTQVGKLEEQKSRLQALINATDLLSSRLNTPDSDTKLTALAQLLRAEKLYSILREPQTFTLRVAVTANGTTKIKKNLFVDAKVRHSAGANLVYQLFNRNGVLAQGDVMQCYIDYRSANEVYRIMSATDSVQCLSQSPPRRNRSEGYVSGK